MVWVWIVSLNHITNEVQIKDPSSQVPARNLPKNCQSSVRELWSISYNKKSMKPPPFELFQKQLRSALNHLYDPEYLRQSPLAGLLHVANQFDTPMLLQRILTEAIEGFHPKPDISVKSQAWNTYHILLFRYSQQLSQDEVAMQLGVSPRQLAREQEVALEMLAFSLWEQCHLSLETGNEARETDTPAASVEDTDKMAGDLTWLSEK